MRLVEVVVLMGAHCISPVEHTPSMTEAGKVQCAIVIEKDTDKGTVKVTPQTAAADPKVVAAIAHFDTTASGTKIVPAFAPAGSPTTEIKPPPATETAADAAAQLPAVSADAQAGESAAAEAPVAVAEDPKPAADEATSSTPATRKVVKPAQAEPQPKAVAKPVEKAPPARKQVMADATPKQTSQCKGSAVAKWYKTADGHRKFRCVRPVPTSDQPPSQIY